MNFQSTLYIRYFSPPTLVGIICKYLLRRRNEVQRPVSQPQIQCAIVFTLPSANFRSTSETSEAVDEESVERKKARERSVGTRQGAAASETSRQHVARRPRDKCPAIIRSLTTRTSATKLTATNYKRLSAGRYLARRKRSTEEREEARRERVVMPVTSPNEAPK